MDSKKIKALLMAGVTLLASGCSAVSESGYVGYMKNEMKYGKGVTQQFQRAVYNANVEWLHEILTNYPEFDVNYYSNEELMYGNHNYETLKAICSNWNKDVSQIATNNTLELLLQNNLNPNIKFSNGYYALDMLCADNKEKSYLVKTMLENGADPNNASSSGFYNTDLGDENSTTLYLPVFWAIYEPTLTNAEDLLNHGATVNYEILDDVHEHSNIKGSAKPYQLAFKSYMEETGESPFTKTEEYAILGESDKLIAELRNGEKLSEEAANTVRTFICSFCNDKALKAWDEIYLSEKNYPSEYLLNIAAYEGNYEIIKYLFDKGIEDFTINEALERAARAGSYDVCKYLIENGCLDEDTVSSTILQAAFQGGDIDTFRFLAQYFNKKGLLCEDDIYYIFVKQVVEWNQYTKNVIDCLIDDCGLNMNAFVSDDMNHDTIEYLFNKGKQLSVFDLPFAISAQEPITVKYILEKGAIPNQGAFSFKFNMSDEERQMLLLPYEESLAAVNSNDIDSCIEYAIKYGTSEIVQMLIDHGADLSDESILACAITDSSKATFDALLNAGASLDYKNDKSKETLVDAAKNMGRDDIVKILRKAKVKSYSGF